MYGWYYKKNLMRLLLNNKNYNIILTKIVKL